jgi:hypothetical protein
MIMYGFEPPLNLKPDWVAALETCPAIDGTGSNPAQEVIGRQFAWMDPVQKDITATLFATARSLLPRQEGETVDWDPAPHQIDNTKLNATLRAYVQAAVTGPNGRG